MKVDLPQPNPQQLEQSNKLKSHIQQRIGKSAISFEEFMRMCLYTEGLGYYESGLEIFGERGDFITSPEEGGFFARAFAAHIKAIVSQLEEFSIIEVGAGSGRFAVDLIRALIEINCKPSCYYIVETSQALQRRQQVLINKELSGSNIKVEWIETLQQPVEYGVVIANEVLDALPVNLVSIQGNQIRERCVSLDEHHEFIFAEQDASEKLQKIVRQRLPEEIFELNKIQYQTEINIHLDEFISRIASFVDKGVFFYIDYGYPQREYYHEQRSMGTLICHFKQVAHDDPLKWPGIQDVTASVDFTALAEAALKIGLSVDCYSTQAHFLMASDALKELQQVDISNSSQVKKLFMPGEMGERFQVMALSKNFELADTELTMRDLRHRL